VGADVHCDTTAISRMNPRINSQMAAQIQNGESTNHQDHATCPVNFSVIKIAPRTVGSPIPPVE
jgi:hypothetical protein